MDVIITSVTSSKKKNQKVSGWKVLRHFCSMYSSCISNFKIWILEVLFQVHDVVEVCRIG